MPSNKSATGESENVATVLETAKMVNLQIGDVTHTIWFDRTEISPRLNRMLKTVKLPADATEEQQEAAREASDAAGCEYLATIVTSWDIVDKQGHPVPLTAEGVSRLSYKRIRAIMAAINPPKMEGGASPD